MRPFERAERPVPDAGVTDSVRPPAAATRRRIVRYALLAGLALLLTACGAPQSALDPQGPFARAPDDLFRLVFWIAVGVFVLVQGLIVYTIVRFRQREGDDRLPRQVHGNTKLEIVWTVIPALILAGIAVPTVRMIFELDAEPAGATTIEVIGHRWWWEYRYPDQGIVTANEMVVPAGQPIRLEMTAEDNAGARNGVIHSFWIPSLGGKQDVAPGRISTLNIQADEPGRYLGQCAEYCGLSHANMRAVVEAVPPAEFEQWLAAQQEPAAEPEPGSLAAEGQQLLGQQQDIAARDVGAPGNACVACHAFEPGQTNVGPNLAHLMSRDTFAGRLFDLDEEHLREWLKDPTAMKPMQPGTGIGMPDLSLTDEEIDALVAYLMTLE